MIEAEIPDGMMRVWDKENKKVILVPAPAGGPDNLVLTVRLHDPKEKKNAKLRASWVNVVVARADLQMQPVDFAAKYLLPAVPQLEHFKPKS